MKNSVFIVALILACFGCVNLNRGFVVNKQYRPSGTKVTVLPRLQLKEPYKIFWLRFKIRDKGTKYVLILNNNSNLRVPVSVSQNMWERISIGRDYDVSENGGLVLYIELIKIWRK